ncbi:MAG: ATP-binding protein [Candidatus Zixiibacteriota bacterium]
MEGEKYNGQSVQTSDELTQFSESFETFNKIINNLQRQYLTLEKEYSGQSHELEKINYRLRETIAENRSVTVFLNSILTSLTSGVLVVDKSGTISHFNPAAEKIVGITASTALGKKYNEVISCSMGARFSACETVMTGIEFEAEGKIIRNNEGNDIPVSVSTSLLDDGNDDTYGAVEILFDLTKIKKLEAEVNRVKTLAALGEMAATVAHEVRNPLGGIGGFAALLKRELGDDTAKMDLVDKIISGVDALNKTVIALLDYTRQDQLNLREVSLCTLIEDSVEYELAQDDVKEISIEIDIENEKRNMTVICDPHLMRQVLLNLYRNSREAMNGTGRITIRAGKDNSINGDSNNENEVWIEIEDNGPGIPANLSDKIFQPFFTTKSSQNGSGLGLATVWKTIQAHGGDISVKSEEGRGSNFKIILPSG